MQRDDAKLIRLLKTAGGQIEGIIRMIEDKKYCIDVSNQIMAAQAILSRVNKESTKRCSTPTCTLVCSRPSRAGMQRRRWRR